MPKAPAETKIVRMTGMYGTCKTINVYRGNEQIGGATFCAGEAGGLWYIEACGREATLAFDATKTTEENLIAVEAVLERLMEAGADAAEAA